MDISTNCCTCWAQWSVVCRCFQQWSVENIHTRRPDSDLDDRRIVRTAVAARTASREEIPTHVAPAPWTIGNRLFAAGLRSRVSLARLPLTPWHRQARLLWCRYRVHWRVKWRSVVFIDESRFCLYESDGPTRVRRRPGERFLLDCISPLHTAPTSGFMVWGAISYNSWSHLVFLQGKVNNARYIAQVVNHVLLPFLRQEGDGLFQQDNACLHMVAATQRALRHVQHPPWPARAPISRQLNTYGT